MSHRQTKIIYIVDEAVSEPQVEFLAMDEITNTYVSDVANDLQSS